MSVTVAYTTNAGTGQRRHDPYSGNPVASPLAGSGASSPSAYQSAHYGGGPYAANTATADLPSCFVDAEQDLALKHADTLLLDPHSPDTYHAHHQYPLRQHVLMYDADVMTGFDDVHQDFQGQYYYAHGYAALAHEYAHAVVAPPPPEYRVAVETIAKTGQPIPDDAAKLLAKFEKKKCQRKLRAKRRKEERRLAAAAAAAAVGGTHSSSGATSSNHHTGSSGITTANASDDDVIALRVTSAHPPDHVRLAAMGAEADSSDSDDDAREIPVLPHSTTPPPSMPKPRSMQQLPTANCPPAMPQPKSQQATPASANPTTVSHVKASHNKPSAKTADDAWRVVSSSSKKAPRDSAPTTIKSGSTAPPTAFNPFAVLQAHPEKKKKQPPAAASHDGKAAKPTAEIVENPKEEKPKKVAVVETPPLKDTKVCLAAKKKVAAAAEPSFDDLLDQLQKATAARSAAAPAHSTSMVKKKSCYETGGPDGDRTTSERIEALFTTHNAPRRTSVVDDVLRLLRRVDAHKNNIAARIECLQAAEQLVQGSRGLPAPVSLLLLIHLADVWSEMQEFERSLETALLAVNMANELGSAEGQMRALYREARVYEFQGETDSALCTLLRCVRIAAALDDPLYKGYCASSAGAVYEGIGCPDRARRCFDIAAAAARQTGDAYLGLEAALGQAAVDTVCGAYHAADAVFKTIDAVMTDESIPVDGQLLLKYASNRSQQLFAMDQGDAAVQCAKLLLASRVRRPLQDIYCTGTCCSLIAIFCRVMGEPAKAREWAKRDLDMTLHHGTQRVCDAMNTLAAICCDLGEYTQARALHTRELEHAKQQRENGLIGKAHVGLGIVDLRAGNNQAATAHAILALRSVRPFLTDQANVCYSARVVCYEVEWRALDLLEACYLASGNAAEALLVADQKRCPALTAPRTPSAEAPPRERAPAVMSALQAQGVTGVIAFSFPWDDVAETFVVYAASVSNGDVKHTIMRYPAHALALLMATQSAYRRATSRDTPDIVMLPYRMSRDAEKFATGHPELFCENPHSPNLLPSGWNRAFFDAFLEPAAHLFRVPNAKVVIAADGFLANIPFHALVDPQTDRPLISDSVIALTPSITAVVAAGLAPASATARSDAAPVVINPPASQEDAASMLADGLRSNSVICNWVIQDDARDRVTGAIELRRVPAAPKTPSDEMLCDILQPTLARLDKLLEAVEAADPQQHVRQDVGPQTLVLTHGRATAPRAAHEVSLAPRTVFLRAGFTSVVTATFSDFSAEEATALSKLRSASDFRAFAGKLSPAQLENIQFTTTIV